MDESRRGQTARKAVSKLPVKYQPHRPNRHTEFDTKKLRYLPLDRPSDGQRELSR